MERRHCSLAAVIMGVRRTGGALFVHNVETGAISAHLNRTHHHFNQLAPAFQITKGPANAQITR